SQAPALPHPPGQPQRARPRGRAGAGRRVAALFCAGGRAQAGMGAAKPAGDGTRHQPGGGAGAPRQEMYGEAGDGASGSSGRSPMPRREGAKVVNKMPQSFRLSRESEELRRALRQ
ncbi:unnamed protein product, partial [Prorocentrum cordatum]